MVYEGEYGSPRVVSVVNQVSWPIDGFRHAPVLTSQWRVWVLWKLQVSDPTPRRHAIGFMSLLEELAMEVAELW